MNSHVSHGTIFRMKPPFAYEREPYLTELSTEIVAAGKAGDQPYAILADTLLFPEGGGQPADRGSIGSASVTDVQRTGSGIVHYLDRPVEPGPTVVRLDWERRYDHMQQHTTQHLVSAIAADRFDWLSTSFHIGAETCDIELAVPSLSAADLSALEEAVTAEVRAARPIRTRRVSEAEYAEIPRVRSRGLPDGHEGDVRLVEIEGIDLSTCGGTHLASTAEIETVKLLSTESLRGGTRLYWVAGGRVRRRLSTHEARNAELRELLGTADAEIPALVRRRQEQLKEAARRERDLLDQLADSLAESLAARPQNLVEHHLPGHEASFLQRVARHFVKVAPTRVVFLTSEGPKGFSFALGANGHSHVDLRQAGSEVAARLGGKGGGAGGVFQGSAGSLAEREAAIELLARHLK